MKKFSVFMIMTMWNMKTDTPPSSDDDGTLNHASKKCKYPVFNQNTAIEKIVFELGMKFSSPQELKNAVRDQMDMK